MEAKRGANEVGGPKAGGTMGGLSPPISFVPHFVTPIAPQRESHYLPQA
jgi:hypothetical protein